MSPLDATATEALADDTTRNPSTTENRSRVCVYLNFEGVTFDPSHLYDALNAQWGTVTTEKDAGERNCFIFKVST